MSLNELTEVKISATGHTSPPIPSGTEILLVQDGQVSVGRLYYDLNELYSTEILHPVNAEELSPLATEAVRAEKPELLTSNTDHILTCPLELKGKMIWEKDK